ncbi:LacI family DNA-binding transcriptional regulator [Pasteurellaceae bacterium LIM206]|nr:LacI family DNA-binding transcriptional regulator [Pasteurellaceae bacterium LIM206]
MLASHRLNRGRRSTGKVTLADVAKAVGVGTMTVSRALRTPEMVSDELRSKIERAVRKLGYIPNSAARQLASASSQHVVIITSSIISTENTLILEALQKTLGHSCVQLVILIANKPNWLRELMNYSPLAIILLNVECPPSELEWIQNTTVPCIEIGTKQRKFQGISISMDIKGAVRKMLDFLVAKGYQEIGLLTAKQNLAIFQQYLAGWHTASLNMGIDPHLILHCAEPISFSAGAKLFNESRLHWGKIDALIFLSDELAAGALFEAQRRHLSIPYDVAVVGFGNLDVSEVTYPKLTTIAIPYSQLGISAGEKLLEILTEPHHIRTETIQLPAQIILRDST